MSKLSGQKTVSEEDPMMTGMGSEEDAWEAGMVNCPWSGGGGRGGGCEQAVNLGKRVPGMRSG